MELQFRKGRLVPQPHQAAKDLDRGGRRAPEVEAGRIPGARIGITPPRR
jgi:hypothetical protein